MKRALLFLAGSLPLLAVGAQPALELAGIVAGAPGTAAVLVRDRAAAVSSPWLRAGQEWRGYRVAVIDEGREAATLVRGGERVVVGLRAAHVTEGAEAGLPLVLRGGFSLSGGRLTYSADAVVQLGPFRVSATVGRMEFENGVLRGELHVDEMGVRRVLSEGGNGAAPVIVDVGCGQVATELRVARLEAGQVVTAKIGGKDNPFAGAHLCYTYDPTLAAWRIGYHEPERKG